MLVATLAQKATPQTIAALSVIIGKKMSASENINALSVTLGTMALQVVLMALLSLCVTTANAAAASIDYSKEIKDKKKKPQFLGHAFVIIPSAISFVLLFMSDAVSNALAPLLNGYSIKNMESQQAIAVTFYIDMLVVSYYLYLTGGTERSPFTSVLFTLPAIAIFLRLEPNVFIPLTLFSAILYVALLYKHERTHIVKGKFTSILVNISCLTISLVTGYITRPPSVF